jgi:hypothetical protein
MFKGNFYSDKSLGAFQRGAHVDFYNLHYSMLRKALTSRGDKTAIELFIRGVIESTGFFAQNQRLG